MKRIGYLMLGVATAVSSCASDPRAWLPDVAATAPEAWSATSPTESDPTEAVPVSGGWVESFADTTLNALVIEALGSNYDLAQASARLDQARALARAQGASRLPSLDASATGTRSDSEALDLSSVGYDLTVSWEADLWGRLADRARAGAFDRAAAEADLYGFELSIAARTALAWFDLITAKLLTDLAEDDVATQERSLELTRRRYAAGVTGALDVRLARSSLAASQASLAQQRNEQANAARRLELLLGRYPAGAIQAAADLPALPILSGVGAPVDLLSRRPDVKAAEARLLAAGLRSEEARKALYPRLSLQASVGESAESTADLFDPDALVSTVVGSLIAPIFRGGLLRADRDRTEATARELGAAYVDVVLVAFRETEDALDAEAALADRETAQAIAAEEARAAERLAERSYLSGVSTIFELLDAQRRRIGAERALILARAERVSNRVRFHLALAGDLGVTTDDAPVGEVATTSEVDDAER